MISSNSKVSGTKIFRYVVCILLCILAIFPFYVLIINSTLPSNTIKQGIHMIPGTNFIANYKSLMLKSSVTSSVSLWKALFNSLLITVPTTVLQVYFATLTAYGLTVYHFKGRDQAWAFIYAIMMIPTQVTALGFINLVTDMKLMDTFIPLIVPAIAAPSTFFYMKQYMESTLPLAIIEAARIDGSGEFRTFNTIVLPMMKPAIAVQAIFTFVQNWNNYFTPALVLKTDTKKTLPILIAQLRSADWLKFDMGQVYVMIAFSIFPVIVVYLLLSKFIVSGVALGSVKG